MVAAAQPRLRCQRVPLERPAPRTGRCWPPPGRRARVAGLDPGHADRPQGRRPPGRASPAPGPCRATAGRPLGPRRAGWPPPVHHRAPEHGRLGWRRRRPSDQGQGPVVVGLPVLAPPLEECQLAQQHLGLGGGHQVAGGQQGLAEHAPSSSWPAISPGSGPGQGAAGLAPGRVALGAELQGLGMEAGGCVPTAEGGGPVAGVAQGRPGRGQPVQAARSRRPGRTTRAAGSGRRATRPAPGPVGAAPRSRQRRRCLLARSARSTWP